MAHWRSGRACPDVASRLKDARIKKGIARDVAARELLISIETIENWESGSTEPKCSQLKTLCRLYEITPNEILGVQ